MCDCVITICSPARPPPVLDLRTIMDMEANSLQPLRATPKSPGRYNTSTVFILTEDIIYKQTIYVQSLFSTATHD